MARGSRFTPLKGRWNHNLKVRQSWNKYNLYNLSRLSTNQFRSNTFYQAKFKAKSVSRDYHGSQVREKVWQRMFDRRSRSVIPMDADYLAENDGSIESAGRGSGLTEQRPRTKDAIPYMQMTYAPLERRLDTAVFRALFASSIRQARQFVIHGSVKVNGRRMQYPGYLLNPGDMFQVVPERVMFATGAPKLDPAAAKAKAQVATEAAEAAQAEADAEEVPVIEAEPEEETDDRQPREILKDLRSQAKSILASVRENVGAKRKQDLRAFTKSIQRLLSRSKSETIHTASLEAQFAEIQEQLRIRREGQEAGKTLLPDGSSKPEEQGAAATEGEKKPEEEGNVNILSDGEYNELFAALKSMRDNPVDESKPYGTPWMPREYMSAFAFIPRFLEVNHNICAAVYLRHPVARPGMAEVPTPYAESISGTAYTWYLRRR